ncbi:MAG: cytochrome C [Gemmatimonadales bacterium]|nr:cytochrome C [Gemmatimonadales bacterium]
MSDRAKALFGLALFLVLVAFPMWQTLGAAGDTVRPELELPENETECIEETEYMSARHMELLNQWRNSVVREGETEYTSTAGETYTISLTGTCMECHDNRETFCTRCHDYANVAPRCWNCHIEPEGS